MFIQILYIQQKEVKAAKAKAKRERVIGQRAAERVSTGQKCPRDAPTWTGDIPGLDDDEVDEGD